jgi:hypothetical protein
MITLKQFMEIVSYRICEGSTWNGFAPGAYSLDYWNGDQDGHSLCIIFNTKDQTVYSVQVCDYKNNRAYRFTHLEHRTDLDKEAWDDVNWCDLDVEEDWLEKAQAIVDGRSYDTRVQIPLELGEDELFQLMSMAHERDITLNQLVTEIIQRVIDQEELNQLEKELDQYSIITEKKIKPKSKKNKE